MKLTIVNTLLLIAVLSYLVISNLGYSGDDKQVYVVTGELFAEFDYQKELDAEYNALKEVKLKELESFQQEIAYLEIQARKPKASSEAIAQYNQGYSQYLSYEAKITNELAELNKQYSVNIWEKLNALISQYGEEHNYQVIFGADGTGNIMYAQEDINITKDLITYCNLKYNGK
jgi:outer membrane protein